MRKGYKLNRGSNHKPLKIGLSVFGGFLVIVFAGFITYKFITDSPVKTAANQSNPNKESTLSPLAEDTTAKPESHTQTTPTVDLQPTLDAWLDKTSVDYGVEVYDITNQKVLASHQADKPYYTASIYKFYVAYLTYLGLQSGEMHDISNLVDGQSLLDCQHKMIYSSDSPCGEAVMKVLTQAKMQTALTTFGTSNTNFPQFVTTAHDTNVILNRLAKGLDLDADYTAKILNSMETQIYSRGLMKGFADAKVASKVGFNEDINFHEVGLVTYPDGRQYAVSIFSQGQGYSAPLASLSAAFNAKLKNLSATNQ